ncbi:MAG: ribonuclease E inhibitor RraB [Pseudomonadota bacterium]
MFSNIRTKTKWDVDGPLLWGYFFFDQNQEKLKQAASELEGTGFRVVGLEQVEGKAFFRLHVEKVEVHTPASLHARNSEFYLLADRLSIASYDGMDVGPAPVSNK